MAYSFIRSAVNIGAVNIGAVNVALLVASTAGLCSVAPTKLKPQQPARSSVTTPASLLRYKTPAQQHLLPFVKAHAVKPATALAKPEATSTSSSRDYVSTPSFGGYVNTPLYNARTSASTATGVFDNGVTVELTADFDKDGKPDIATFQEDGTMNILLNTGGALAAPVSYYNPNNATTAIFSAYAVDINKDGYSDIIGFDQNNDAAITWLNLGNGTFGAAITTPVDQTYGFPSTVLVADVNGDGKPDLIYTNAQFLSRTSAAIILEVNLGNGDGTFAAATTSQIQQFTIPAQAQIPNYNIALGDLNGDGNLDIAVGVGEQTGQSSGNYVVTTALGNGDGTFAALGVTMPVNVPVLPDLFGNVFFNSTGVQIVDLSGDGKLDLASDINGTLEVALGNGAGGFATPVASNLYTSGTTQLLFTDLNADGKVDMVAGGGTLAVQLGNGNGTFAAPTPTGQYVIDPATEQGLVLADINGDGINDVAEMGGDYKQIALFFGNGKGAFRGAPMVTSSTDSQSLDFQLETTGTYTASGYSDAIFLHATLTGTEILTGVSDGKGNFTYVQTLAGAFPTDFQYIQPMHADLNGDGLDDLVITGSSGQVYVAFSNGDGTFATPVSLAIPSTCPVYYAAAGDVNGDGVTDLLIPYGGDATCGSTGTGVSGYYVVLGSGTGTFSAPVFTATGTELYGLSLADINGDGKLDLVINDEPFLTGSGFNVSLATGNGDGTFAPSNAIVSNYLVSDVAVADVNNDGKLDLVLSSEEVQGNNVTTGGILIVPGNGDGTFASSTQIATGNFFFGMQVADMNNDGNQDIVATLNQTYGQPNTYYGMVTLLGFGNGQFSAPYNQLESLGSTLPMIGNFYNDNAPDVITESGYGPALFIGQGSTSVALTVTSANAALGTSEALTATITAGMTGLPALTGSVSFYDATALLGSSSVTSGAATFTDASLAVGSHSITAVYSGDSNFNPATSAASPITITTLAPAFTLAGTPATLSITSGTNGIVSLSLAANATFSGAVTLTCSGAPTNATCVVNPGSVTLAAGGISTATLVVGTTTAKAAMHPESKPWEAPSAGVTLAALCGVCFGRRRRGTRFVALLGLGLMLSIGGLLTGCSSGGGGGKTAPATGPTSFTVTVTATPTGTGTAQSTTVSVTVN